MYFPFSTVFYEDLSTVAASSSLENNGVDFAKTVRELILILYSSISNVKSNLKDCFGYIQRA